MHPMDCYVVYLLVNKYTKVIKVFFVYRNAGEKYLFTILRTACVLLPRSVPTLRGSVCNVVNSNAL